MISREIAWGALFVALGLTFPILFHMVGLGPMFLPMFLPVLGAGLLLQPVQAALVGLVTPMLSAVLTGMPPLAPPMAPIMSVEGVVVAAVSGLLYQRLRWNIYLAAAVAVVAQRLVMALLIAALAPLFGLPGPLAAFGALAQGLPGVVLLIGPVPFLVRRFESSAGGSHAAG